jgi:hypothetical protein
VTKTRPPTRRDEASQALELLARRLGPGKALPPIRTLRSELGFSNVTLSGALSALEARGAIVRRPGSGIYVSESLISRRIALVCNPRFLVTLGASPFWQLLLSEAARRADSEHLASHFAPGDAAELPFALAEAISDRLIDGVIAIGLPHAQTRWIERYLPVVAFAGPARWMVSLAFAELIQIGVSALARARAPRITLLLDAPNPNHEASFSDATAEYGLMGSVVYAANTHESFALARIIDPDEAILSLDDMLTQGLLMGLSKAKLPLPKIATHANIGSAALIGWDDQLIQLAFDPSQLARTLFELLATVLSGETPKNTTPAGDAGSPEFPEPLYQRTLRPTLILPESSS